jgi:hypothetical protein
MIVASACGRIESPSPRSRTRHVFLLVSTCGLVNGQVARTLAGGSLGRGVFRHCVSTVLRCLALLSQGDSLLHKLLRATTSARGDGGESGFLLGKKTDFHALERSISPSAVNDFKAVGCRAASGAVVGRAAAQDVLELAQRPGDRAVDRAAKACDHRYHGGQQRAVVHLEGDVGPCRETGNGRPLVPARRAVVERSRRRAEGPPGVKIIQSRKRRQVAALGRGHQPTGLLAIAGADRIAGNQMLYVEHAVLRWCERHRFAVTLYSAFGHGRFPDAPIACGRVLAVIAQAHGATPRRIPLANLTRWPSLFTIPKALTVEHAEENAGDLRLSEADIEMIDAAFPPQGARVRVIPSRRDDSAFRSLRRVRT